MNVKPCLNKILKERRMTQIELAHKTGIKQAFISRFDHQQSHKDEILFAVSKSLGLKIEELFEVSEKEKGE